MIYFDFAATTPLDKEAADFYVKAAVDYFGNPSSLHDIGSRASTLLENCREEFSSMLGIDKKGLFFTSGGSEGNFLAIEALLSASEKGKNHIITGIAEHSSIHGSMARLEKLGFTVTYLPFNAEGIIDAEQLAAAMTSGTALVCIQHVNSEIGTIQPIEEISRICKENGVYFHSDFVQSFGKLELRKIAKSVSSFSFSGHKIYGPKGIGGVYVDPSIGWSPLFPGTTHESGLRPGTVNVPAVAAMTLAAEKMTGHISDEYRNYQLLRKAFLEKLDPISPYVTIYGSDGGSQLPSIIGLGVSGIEGQLLMLECNRLGFAISTGSACQAGMQSPSKTMLALGIEKERAKEFIRISFGNTTSFEDVHKLGEALIQIVNKLKPYS
jgi:cysteine desulfurase